MQAIFRETLQAGADAWGLTLTGDMLAQLEAYADRLLAANAVMNLTAITDPREVAQRHLLDAIHPEALSRLPQGARVIDVGTGAGLPGLPLAIVRPDLAVTLSDSLGKRIRFLQETVEALGLSARVDTQWARAEELGRRAGFREAYDVACARAVAALPVLCEYVLPMVRVGGSVLCWKGAAALEEAEAASRAAARLGGGRPQATPYGLPGLVGNWHLVEIPKRAPTPKAYPRKAGTPAKQPLS